VKRLDRHGMGFHCEDPVSARESLEGGYLLYLLQYYWEDSSFQQFAEVSGEDVSSCVRVKLECT
jgi:hypothetical protein